MNTKHISTCQRVFKRYDPKCPRCQELAQGAPARPAWFTRHDWIETFHPCDHNSLNPGGYCTVCGNGRDFS
jgi:hypothetical protein